MNLALSMAQEVDLDVVLVDGDVARRTATHLLGLSEAPGLTDLLADSSLRCESVLVPTSIQSLSILPAGQPHALSVELLSSARMQEVSDRLASAAGVNRVVIYDSPPILAAAEALSLCAVAGQIVVVVKAGSTPRQSLITALDQLDPNKAINMILNKSLHVEHGDYYGAYYGYDGA
jgi:Mrp family chromosome partitioning ATPase